ncbi:MAG: 4Fe-4S dicluster domain-containing protein [Elusimicrobiota bacterium]
MKRILIDIEVCYRCKKCEAQCSYYHHQSNILKEPITNNGVERFLARAHQFVICRRCEEPFCVRSCPNEALFQNENKLLQRNLYRCTGCLSCSIGCPFGVIYPELLDYKSSMCDYCAERADGKPPVCTRTCPKGAIQYVEIEESREKNIYFYGDYVAIHGIPWQKDAKAG